MTDLQSDDRPGVDPAAGEAAPVPGRSSLPIHEALARVMADVMPVGKGSHNKEQGYDFRGIDAVVNAVGPALRAHGVIVAPVEVVKEYGDVTAKSGKIGRDCRVLVTYRWTGPDGTHLDTVAPGESMDWGDKATSKAMSVAYRTCLIQTLCIPTGEPDPDASTYDRGQAGPTAQPPQALVEAVKNVGAAWRIHYGQWDEHAVAELFGRWSGGEIMREAPPHRLNAFAAYLVDMPKSEAGGDPADAPTGPEDVGPPMATKGQVQHVIIALKGHGIGGDREQQAWIGEAIGREIESRKDLTADDYQRVRVRLAELDQANGGAS